MNFHYRAYLVDGREEAGTIEASGKPEALRKLAAQGRAVFDLTDQKAKEIKPKADKQRSKNFALFTRRFNAFQLFSDLALLTEAGLTVTQALRSTHSTEVVAEQRKVIGLLLDNMNAGTSAAASFGALKSIPADSVGLVASGESAGRLPDVFRALAQQYEDRAKLKAQLTNALGYPAFLVILMVLALMVLTFALVPAIEPIFQSADRVPPFIVSALSALRAVLSGSFLIFAPLSGIVILVLALLPRPRKMVAAYLARLVTRLPLIGGIVRKTALSRYLSSLSLLLANGTTMSKALELAASSVSIAPIQSKLLTIRDSVATGERLPVALENCGLFDDRIVSLIAVGDEANRLAVVTKRAAHILDSQTQATTTRFIAVLTPAMTIALGLLIGGLVVSVMTALLSINEIAIQ